MKELERYPFESKTSRSFHGFFIVSMSLVGLHSGTILLSFLIVLLQYHNNSVKKLKNKQNLKPSDHV